MTRNHPNRKAALAHLEENASQCVQWVENGVEMSAIYWNGKRRIQRASVAVNTREKKEF